jgi:hypothetical protein
MMRGLNPFRLLRLDVDGDLGLRRSGRTFISIRDFADQDECDSSLP